MLLIWGSSLGLFLKSENVLRRAGMAGNLRMACMHSPREIVGLKP
jgi:hypothetical protein